MRARPHEAYRVGIEDDVAVLTWLDIASPETALEATAALMRMQGFRQGMPLMMVDPGTELNAPAEELREYARILARRSDAFGRFAMVVHRLLHYGLARMMSAYAQGLGVDLKVATSVADAKAWLKRDVPISDPPDSLQGS